jgi:flagellar biosynthetic protein FlhB
LVIVAVIGNLIQTGPVLSVEPISPDLDRINPVSGFKRIISVRTLFSAFRAALKLTLLCVTTYFSLKGLLPQFNHLSGLGPAGLFQIMLGDFSSLGLKLAGVLFLISLLDLIYIKREFAKKMKMSTREVKDEAKSRDGDPRIRARLRQLRKEMLKRSLSLRNTGAADVLITNPTHIAVALRYSHGEMTSPQLVAKGRGSMAVAMRMIAARHRIPVVQSPSLARALYRDLDIDQHVQPGLYSQVARIIVWVFARRDAVRRAATNGTDRQNSSHESSPRNTGSLRWTS